MELATVTVRVTKIPGLDKHPDLPILCEQIGEAAKNSSWIYPIIKTAVITSLISTSKNKKNSDILIAENCYYFGSVHYTPLLTSSWNNWNYILHFEGYILIAEVELTKGLISTSKHTLCLRDVYQDLQSRYSFLEPLSAW
ncbi:hypothetical protein NGAV_gp03 [Hapavirus ngaingan]|uniref:Uncharacterized protein U1/U2 n=1 Tax=Hapavirus ngaingan TaxID=1972623 RepID=D3GGL2_9RHAB|nr:hypothetical protein NGAV_gp03 [Hapavirus ngaingan]ACX83603.1 unknown [Hapavirus ngaingan]